MMHVLVGETRDRALVAELQHRAWGRIWTTETPAPFAGERWGFDNGAFAAWLAGRPFAADEFRMRLDRALAVGVPSLAVVPDIVAGGLASLEFSLGWRERLPDDWPWYLAVQDGMRPQDVVPLLSRFAGIFLGGTTRFKAHAGRWCRVAREHGRAFHYGRAGTLTRIEHAQLVGADSLDSSFPLWTRARWRQFVEALTAPRQALLPGTLAAIRAGSPVEADMLTGTSY